MEGFEDYGKETVNLTQYSSKIRVGPSVESSPSVTSPYCLKLQGNGFPHDMLSSTLNSN